MENLLASAKWLSAVLTVCALCGCAGGAPLAERMYEGLRLRNQLQQPLHDTHSGDTPLNYRQYQAERNKLLQR